MEEGAGVAAVAVPDAKKGERVLLLTETPLELGQLRERLIAAGTPALMVPAAVQQVDAIPRLGSGKTHYAALAALVAPDSAA